MAVVLGALVGGLFPDLGVALKPLGTAFVGELDRTQADRVLSGGDPFDEATMLDDDHGQGATAPPRPTRGWALSRSARTPSVRCPSRSPWGSAGGSSSGLS